MKRRDFLKYGAGGVAALVVSKTVPWWMEDVAHAALPTQVLNFTITDAMKEMVTHNQINAARCYFWIYKDTNPDTNLPAECPGPHIFVQEGQRVQITIKNDLDENHSFFIPGLPGAPPTFDSGPIAPGATVTRSFIPRVAGSFLYHDNLSVVNRVMGLHGAFIVMPRRAPYTSSGHQVTPYSRENVTPSVQQLFDDFGTKAWWPGLSWQAGGGTLRTPRFRQHVWVLHQASPNLFEEVGNTAPGTGVRIPRNFRDAFLRDPFSPTRQNRIPQYFTISGQSGHFAHNNPYNNPNFRVGEPTVIRILNAGLWTHSMHIHANHVYVIGINGVPQVNPFWVDVFTVDPMDVIDWANPYMRPPDVPNERGIGRADTPLISPGVVLGPHPCWPPLEEIRTRIPANLTDGAGNSLAVQLSPLCYPMHDHSEPSQTSQGGNYNLGLIAGMNFIGDRNDPSGVINFPNQPLIHGPGPNGVFPPTVGPPWFNRH